LAQMNKTYWKRGEKKGVLDLNERNLMPSIPLTSRVGY